jgi:hypothetical protein
MLGSIFDAGRWPAISVYTIFHTFNGTVGRRPSLPAWQINPFIVHHLDKTESEMRWSDSFLLRCSCREFETQRTRQTNEHELCVAEPPETGYLLYQHRPDWQVQYAVG